MAITSTVIEATKLTSSAMIELFILDATSLGAAELLYFHNGTNGIYEPIIFDTVEYTPFPIEATGFDIDGKGQLPRPHLKAANIKGVIGQYLRNYNDFVGAKVIRRKVFAKFLDAANFPGNSNPFGTPDPTGAYPDEIFYFERKIAENRVFVEWELVTALELPQAKIPNRLMVASQCVWKYRDATTCGYVSSTFISDIPVADYANKKFAAAVIDGGYGFTLLDKGEWNSATTYNIGDYVYIESTLENNAGEKFYYVCKTNGTTGALNKPNSFRSIVGNPWVADACSKMITGCKCRFPTGALPFGGFQGISRTGMAR